MKIVLDMNLSPLWVPFLEAGGYEGKHWTEIGAITAPDIEIGKRLRMLRSCFGSKWVTSALDLW